MPKRVRKSLEFGRWVKRAREASEQSQQDLAEKANLTQQYLSRIESEGLVPKEEELESLFVALGKSVQEITEMLDQSSAPNPHALLLEDEFIRFRNWLVELDGPVHLYVIRETPEVVNPISVDQHCSILQERKERDLYISILFRYSTYNLRSSFITLARDIEDAWAKRRGKLPQEEARCRISGYYRNPDVEENQERALPMALPVILVKAKAEYYIYCYGSHPDVYNSYKNIGKADYFARFKSIVLLPVTSTDSANLFASWVGGSRGNQELSPRDWIRIPWPEQAV